jgi:hypothetical protein
MSVEPPADSIFSAYLKPIAIVVKQFTQVSEDEQTFTRVWRSGEKTPALADLITV